LWDLKLSWQCWWGFRCYLWDMMQWQTTPKNLPRMQRTRAIPVAWLSSGLCPDRPKGWIPIIIIMMQCWVTQHCGSRLDSPPKNILLFMHKGLMVGNYWVWLALGLVWSRSGVQIWQWRLAVLTCSFFVGFSRWMEYEQDGISSSFIVLHVLLNKGGNMESCVVAVALLWNVPLTHIHGAEWDKLHEYSWNWQQCEWVSLSSQTEWTVST